MNPEDPHFGGPNGAVPPGSRTPFDPEEEESEDEADDDGPTTEEDEEEPAPPTYGKAPEGPVTPGVAPPGPDTPAPVGPPAPEAPTRAARTAPRTRPAAAMSWRNWWDFSRANLVDLRARRLDTITPVAAKERDPLGALHANACETLRRTAMRRAAPVEIRAAALHALGRAGGEADVDAILAILRDSGDDRTVRESAAIALALLPPVGATSAREVRRDLEWCITAPQVPQRLREFALIAAGFRARDDEAIGLALAARCKGGAGSWGEVAALALALGLSENTLLLPELLNAANGELCGVTLPDVGRSHAVVALGRTRSAAAVPALAKLLQSRRTGIHSRRSAALALGCLLREGGLDADAVKPAVRGLRSVLDGSGDPLVRGYCAVALGAAQPPHELNRLKEVLRTGSDPVVQSYAALGLGLAARAADEAEARGLRTLLSNELAATKAIEQGSALTLALGLAKAREAAPDLVVRLENKSSPAPLRMAAAEALGFLGVSSAPVMESLRAALLESEVHLARAAAESLAILGDRASAVHVLGLLDHARSSHLHSHLATAVGLSGHPGAAEPLLALFKNEGAADASRADAAMALGILGDLRETDALWRFGAWFNLDATTSATREFLIAGCGCAGRGRISH